jgi:asparagine synthetase B (glutamine-hydrolysing)
MTPNLVRHTQLPFEESGAVGVTEASLAPAIRSRLEAVFRGLKEELRGRRLYVSLSGGLDSTAIASLAREFLGELTAVTFTVGGNRSEDLISAEKVAKELGMRLVVIEVSAKDILGALDEALLWGQDWREFNVHCALVNVAVGRAIRKDSDAARSTERPVVITGDVMNELMADYSAVSYRGAEYYTLPKVPIGLLRRVLVGGLDAGDREVGVFWHCGVETIQPYALAASAYTAVPASLLTRRGAKQSLVRAILGDRIPGHVYGRKKTRAQEGTAESGGGTLSVCVDNGIDANWLKRRFAEIYGLDPAELHHYIRGGYYRGKPATIPPP